MADHLEKQFKQGAIAAKSLSSIKFGDHDWMRPNEPSARETMNEVAKQTGIRTSVEVIPNAGHHLYLDNSIDFTRHLLSHK
jgi:pimeloyl-ACP methyl ester carboxylesterase